MSNAEEIFRKAEFLEELRALMKKYNVVLVEHEQYDGEEGYAGSTYSFESDVFSLDVGDLKESV